jgi:hypothetical protein
MDYTIIINVVLLIAGFVFLIKGSDIFVDGASSIASILKIPTIIVGLTIVALGTSAPEAAVSITSSLTGSNAMAVSNVIGSNMFNLLMGLEHSRKYDAWWEKHISPIWDQINILYRENPKIFPSVSDKAYNDCFRKQILGIFIFFAIQ